MPSTSSPSPGAAWDKLHKAASSQKDWDRLSRSVKKALLAQYKNEAAAKKAKTDEERASRRVPPERSGTPDSRDVSPDRRISSRLTANSNYDKEFFKKHPDVGQHAAWQPKKAMLRDDKVRHKQDKLETDKINSLTEQLVVGQELQSVAAQGPDPGGDAEAYNCNVQNSLQKMAQAQDGYDGVLRQMGILDLERDIGRNSAKTETLWGYTSSKKSALLAQRMDKGKAVQSVGLEEDEAPASGSGTADKNPVRRKKSRHASTPAGDAAARGASSLPPPLADGRESALYQALQNQPRGTNVALEFASSQSTSLPPPVDDRSTELYQTLLRDKGSRGSRKTVSRVFTGAPAEIQTARPRHGENDDRGSGGTGRSGGGDGGGSSSGGGGGSRPAAKTTSSADNKRGRKRGHEEGNTSSRWRRHGDGNS
jgi:uncharacterized membrane protein YgcG